MADRPDCYSNPAKSVTSLTQAAIDQALNEVSQECTLPEVELRGIQEECHFGTDPVTGDCIVFDVPRLPRTGSGPYHSTPSIDEFEDGINGMRRELSEQTIHINVQPSEEYLESHQFDGTQMVASLSRLYTEDEDEHYSGRPIPALSIGKRPCNRYQFNVNSPPLSIASSTTDFGELFNDTKRLPDCHSCDCGFTDDEIAGKWKIHSDHSELNECQFDEDNDDDDGEGGDGAGPCTQSSLPNTNTNTKVQTKAPKKPSKDDRDVAKCYRDKYPEDLDLVCKKERRMVRRERTARGERVSDDDMDFRCHRTQPATGCKPSSRQPGSSLRVSRRHRDERDEREERHDRRSSRRKSLSRKEEGEREKQDYVESDRRSRRRASQRRKREEEAQETCDGNERRRRRRSRDNKEERTEYYTRNESRRSRRRSASQYAVDESEVEERRYGGRKSSLNRVKMPSKGESFLRSLKEAKNICFFKNPYFDEHFDNAGDPMQNARAKKNSGFYCGSSTDEFGRNSKGVAQRMSPSKNSSLRRSSNQSVNYHDFTQVMQSQMQMQNQLHFPPFSAQSNMQAYKQPFINTVYSPLKPINNRKRVDT